MPNFKQNFIDKMVTPITQENDSYVTAAYVVRADSKNNTCDIKFVDKHGKITKRDNIYVRITGSGMDWFPVKDDIVNIEIGKDTCVIVSRDVSNYNADVRSKMELKKDIHTDSFGAPPGGSIY